MSTSKAATVPQRRPFFRRDPLTSIAGVLLVFFVSQIMAGLILSFYPALKNWTAEQGTHWLETSVWAQFFYILLAEVFAIWLVFWLLKKAKVSRQRIGVIRPQLADISYALAGYAVYFISYLIIITIASNISDVINVDQQQQIGFDTATGSQLYLVFAALVILPPMAEELLFRGFLFTSLRQKFRLRYAVIVTSILFGIAHLQFGSGAPLLWVAAIDTFVLSCVLCMLREKTGRIWASMLLHALKNGIAFVVLFHAAF